METVVVERSFSEPTTFAQLQAAEAAVAWCLAQHEVRFLRSYLSLDGRSMLCIYQAPDAEAVRITQRHGSLPFARVWSAAPLRSSEQPCARPGRSTIVVERDLPSPMRPEEVSSLMATAGHCLAIHRADHLTSYLARDGKRLVCVFDALDTDGVLSVNRTMGLAASRAWPATFHEG